jgi:hypothetical protein
MRKVQLTNSFLPVFFVIVFLFSASIIIKSTTKSTAITEYNEPQSIRSYDMLWEAVARQFVSSSTLP